MMENVRKISKRYYVRQIVACWLVLWMGFGLPLRVAMANPTPDSYDLPGGVGGPGTLPIDSIGINAPVISGVNSEIMDIKQTAGEAIVKWHTFDIGSDASVEFSQPTSLAAVLNRVNDGNVSGIMGSLTANGRVFVINPAGIIFGHNASVNVAQLVASALPMSDPDFLAAATNPDVKMKFGPGSGDVTIVGALDATETGSLYFVGKSVYNYGDISCPDGLVVMAAGEVVYLGQPGSDVIVQLADLTAGPNNKVKNKGYVGLTGEGRVRKLVLAAGDVWSAAIDKTVEQLAAVSTGPVYFDGAVHAYDDGGSDAVADVTIITGGDYTVDEQIYAEAEATGGGDNAFASVTIDAGGNVTVDDYMYAYAYTGDGSSNNAGNLTATVDIDADGNVTVKNDKYIETYACTGSHSEGTVGNLSSTIRVNSGGDVALGSTADDEWGDLYANAYTGEGSSGNAGNLSSTVDIDAVGNVTVSDYTYVDSYAYTGEDSSGNADNVSATVDIYAGGNVVVETDDDQTLVRSEAYTGKGSSGNAGNVTATTTVDAVGDVTVEDSLLYSKVYTGDNSSGTTGNLSATTTINAGGDVDVITESGSKALASIQAKTSGGATNTSEVLICATLP